MSRFGEKRLAEAKRAVEDLENEIYDLKDEIASAEMKLMDARQHLLGMEMAHLPCPWKEDR